MNFSSDADLLGYEPNVFVDVAFSSQKTLRVTDGVIAGSTLTSVTGGFDGLAAGDVVVLEVSASERQGHAVESVTDDNTLVLVSLPTLSVASPLVVEGRTFREQAAVVHDQLLRAVGIEPDDNSPGALDETAVLSPFLMGHLEALGTLARVYAAAVASGGDNTVWLSKAAEYAEQFERDLLGSRVIVDTDGDGEGDEWRTPGIGTLRRG